MNSAGEFSSSTSTDLQERQHLTRHHTRHLHPISLHQGHMYTIRTTPLSGLGVFATRPIPKGTRIFSEKPLLSIPSGHPATNLYSSSLLLSPTDSRRVHDLSSHTTRTLSFLRWNQALLYTFRSLLRRGEKLRPGWWKVPAHVRTLSIFRSNSFFQPELQKLSLFPGIARVNHSCAPNSQGNWNPGLDAKDGGRFNVYATRDIEKDEEVTISYLVERGQLGAVRREKLLDSYGFECICPLCVGRESESRRVDFAKRLEEFAVAEETAVQRNVNEAGNELALVKAYISMLELDGIAGRELSSLYFEAAKLSRQIDEFDDAERYAKRGLELDRDCLGEDHPEYVNGVETVAAMSERPLQRDVERA